MFIRAKIKFFFQNWKICRRDSSRVIRSETCFQIGLVYSLAFPIGLPPDFPYEFYINFWILIWEIFILTNAVALLGHRIYHSLLALPYCQTARRLRVILYGSPQLRFQGNFDPNFFSQPYQTYPSPDLFYGHICRLVEAVEKGLYNPNETCILFMNGLILHLKRELDQKGVSVRPLCPRDPAIVKFLPAPENLPPLTVFQLQRLLILCYEFRSARFISAGRWL